MEAYIGMIIMFAGSYEPMGWMFCDGRVLQIAQYQALYAILGTTYGGDGVRTFALPDLRGRVCLAPGSAPGLTPYTLGQTAGKESARLTSDQMPAHTHSLSAHTHAFAAPANKGRSGSMSADGTVPATTSQNAYAATADTRMLGGTTGEAGAGATGSAGGTTPVSTIQPVIAINFLMCYEGLFPPRQ